MTIPIDRLVCSLSLFRILGHCIFIYEVDYFMIFWGKSPSCSIISTVSPYIEVMWRHLIGSLITEIRDSEIVESEHLCVL